MTVEQIIDEPRDQFPIGMRVLAVDDDRICLSLLEKLLRKCLYHVTTTNEASMALKLLKENKDKFDLVISDVYMPDMDGFKLLELMGLETDVPVIMLSENDDPRLVMKGISYGACYYLLKPIRFEELKNIWQHVIRRKRLEPKNRNVSNKQHHGVVEGGQGQTGMGSSDQTGKLNKKKKNRNADEDEDRDESTQENEDPAAQKKPRVVWSAPLHGKFVAAVNHLGVEKAVPKRILEFMNVEKLTRANVASHLQKYRLCLKKMSSVAGMDSSYLRMDSHNGLRNFNKLTGSQLQNAALRSFPHNGMLGRLNTPASWDIRGLSSLGMVRLGHSHNSSYPVVDRGKLHPVLLSGNENESTLQRMPTSLEFGQLQDNKNPIQIREQLSTGDNSMDFPLSSGLSDAKVTSGGSSDSLFRSTIYPSILPGHIADAQVRGGFGNESSAEVASFGSKDSSHLPDHVRCEDKWSSAVQSFEIQSDTLSSHGPSKQDAFSCSSFRDNMLPMGQLIGNDFHDGSSVSSMPIQLQDPVTYLQCQAVPTTGNVAENMNCTLEQVWNGQKEGISNSSTCDFMNSSRIAQYITGQLGHSLDPNNTSFHSDVDANFDGPLPMLHNEVVKSAVDATVYSKQAYLSGLGKPLGNGTYNNFDSSEDLFDVLMKQE